MQSKVESGLLLDPSADEAYREDAGILMCMMTTNNEVKSIFSQHSYWNFGLDTHYLKKKENIAS